MPSDKILHFIKYYLYYTDVYSTGNKDELQFNYILNSLIEKNLFTKKQLSIIYNKRHNPSFAPRISTGAYYRQVKQCRKKFEHFIYTILVFRLLDLLDDETLKIIESLVMQLEKISHPDRYHDTNSIPNDIINVIEQIIKKTKII